MSTQKEQRQIFQGAKIGFEFAENGYRWEHVLAWHRIQVLNIQHTSAWMNYNNNGGNVTPEREKRMLRRIERLEQEAIKIAERYDWKIDMSGGLYWRILHGGREVPSSEWKVR